MSEGSIGERVRIIRGNESRKYFAEKFGIGTATLQRYEDNERTPDVDFLMKLQKYAQVTLDYLVNGEDISLSKEERNLLNNYRTSSQSLKNQVQLLLIGVGNVDNATENVVSSPVNSGSGTQLNGTNPTINNAAPLISKDVNGNVSIKARGKRAQAAFNIKNE